MQWGEEKRSKGRIEEQKSEWDSGEVPEEGHRHHADSALQPSEEEKSLCEKLISSKTEGNQIRTSDKSWSQKQLSAQMRHKFLLLAVKREGKWTALLLNIKACFALQSKRTQKGTSLSIFIQMLMQCGENIAAIQTKDWLNILITGRTSQYPKIEPKKVARSECTEFHAMGEELRTGLVSFPG